MNKIISILHRILSIIICIFLSLALTDTVRAEEDLPDENEATDQEITDIDESFDASEINDDEDSYDFSEETNDVADEASADAPSSENDGHYADNIRVDGKSTFYLEYGNSIQLKYILVSNDGNTDFSDETVTFTQKSGMKGIVSIDDQGVVTAGARSGTASITASIHNGMKVYYNLIIGPAITNITFDDSRNYVLAKDMGSILLYEYISIEPAGSSANAIEFSSDNADVMTINSYGYAEIKDTGKVTITAAYIGNSSVNASRTFEIKETAVPSSMASVGSSEVTLYKDLDGIFEVSYQPGNSDQSTEWSSSNPDVLAVRYSRASVASFTAIKAGSAVVTATSTANPSLSVSFNVTVKDTKQPKGLYKESIKINEVENSYSLTLSELENPEVYYFRLGSKYAYTQSLSAGQCIPTSGLHSRLNSSGYFQVYDGGAAGTIKSRGETFGIIPLKTGEITYTSSENTIRMVIVDTDEMLLNVARSTLPAGTETSVTASTVPYDPDVKYSSSDESIFTVDDDGTLHAIKPGTAILRAVSGTQTKEREIRVLFTDVADSLKFFYSPVYWAFDHNITTGTGPSEFSPNTNVTRGQIVTFLYRAAGEPPVSGTSSFTDVKKSSYYYNAVLWASKNKITTGTSETTFSPNEYCTRAQIVTFLYRYMNEPDVSAAMPFEDVKKDKFYYKPVLWALQEGITTGTTSTTFSPNEICTRGQAVTFLYRSVEKS